MWTQAILKFYMRGKKGDLGSVSKLELKLKSSFVFWLKTQVPRLPAVIALIEVLSISLFSVNWLHWYQVLNAWGSAE